MNKYICITRKKLFFLDQRHSININGDIINFKIHDQTHKMYQCRLWVGDFIRIHLEPEGQTFDEINTNDCKMKMDKNNKRALITNIQSNNKIMKIYFRPCKIKLYYENRSILKFNCEFLYMHVKFNRLRNFYGLSERASNLRLKIGRNYRLYNTDEFGLALDTNKPLYGSVPFLLGVSKYHSVGLLWQNQSEIRVQISKVMKPLISNKRVVQWWSEAGSTDMVCFISKTSYEVRKSLMLLTGRTPLPPLFAIGYHQCRWNYNDQADVIEVDKSMDKSSIPYDVIWLDIEHTHGKRYMTWDTDKFNPQELIQYLKQKNRNLVVIIDPHLKVDPEYEIYREAKSNGYLIMNEDGSPFVGECWPSESSWVDFINVNASSWWSNKIAMYLQNLNCTSTSNNIWIWNDMNEPSVFKCVDNQMRRTAKHSGNVNHGDVHNIYGQKMAKATWDGILKATDHQLRPFLLSRSFYTGSQQYGAIWTGDNESTWKHLQISVAMMLSLSICGIDFCGADVGGFYGNPDSELLSRWYQLGTLQPFFRAHAHNESERREPYLIQEPYKSVIRNAILLRYRMLSYWYLCFWLADKNCDPVISPVWMAYPNEFCNNDEMFMIGTDILARPIVTPDCKSISVVLPGNGTIWYQYCNVSSTWKVHKCCQQIILPISLNSMPVFNRGGSCVVMKDESCLNVVEWQRCPYSLYVFPVQNQKSYGCLYSDDYKTFDYKNKESYFLIRFIFDCDEKSINCQKEHGENETTAANNLIMKSITIVKCQTMSWSEYNILLVNGTSFDNCEIIHSEDKIEILNLNLNLLENNVLKFQ